MFRVASTSFLLASIAGTVLADTASITVSDPTNTVPEVVTVGIGLQQIPVTIPPGAPAAAKRDLIVAALRAAGYEALADGNTTSLTISDLPVNTIVMFDPGKTGEPADAVRRPEAEAGTIRFVGAFEPIDSDRLPAIFTAGILTDVGELTAQVSSAELNFQTDGPIICQALFQRLAPRAPQFGAVINFASDRLEVYFDPAYSISQGGVVFGTTSPSDGCSGEVRPRPPRCLADFDGNGVLNVFDFLSFQTAFSMLDPRADLDGNGLWNVFDFLMFQNAFSQGC